LGLIKLHSSEDNPCNPDDELCTCTGSLHLPTDEGDADVFVSDCVSNRTGRYTLTANVVSQGADNCGHPLSCGSTPDGTAVTVAGAVDSYTFYGTTDEQVTLKANAVDRALGPLRLRVFTPQGEQMQDTCSESLTLRLHRSGRHTVLVSECNGS